MKNYAVDLANQLFPILEVSYEDHILELIAPPPPLIIGRKRKYKKLNCHICKVLHGKNTSTTTKCKGCGRPMHEKCFIEEHDKYYIDLSLKKGKKKN